MTETQSEKIGVPVPLGRRINEIIDSKYGLSIRSVALKMGDTFAKDTLRRILSGERYCSPSELEKIASVLKVKIERLKQTDTESLVKEIVSSLKWKTDLPKTQKNCEYYHSIALGWSEKSDALNFLAHAYFEQGKYNKSHELWIESFEYAKKVAEKYGVTERLYGVLNNLMVSYTARKEYSNLAGTLAIVENIFQSDPEKMGAILHSKAMIAEQFGNIEQTRANLYESLFQLERSGITIKIGRAQVNVGYFEFKNHNYSKAKEMLQEAIKNLAGDNLVLPIAVKEYAKVLLKLGENESVVGLIEKYYSLVNDKPELQGKFDILLSIAKNDTGIAENVLYKASVGKSVRALACRFLINHYNSTGDSTVLLKYYKMEEKILQQTDILHKEEF